MTLQSLTSLLQCPISKQPLLLDGDLLKNSDGHGYPIIQGVPVFIEEGRSVKIHPREHFSNEICGAAKEIITSTSDPVLNLSAGGSEIKQDHVVELEYSIFRNTDVVGDAHALPFQDGVFGACICMNAFEHYRNPRVVASEILRVLKPGGTLFMHTAGLQPLHEPPYHFYNVTRFGLEEWLTDFEIEKIRVSPNFNPGFALAWLASEIERGVRHHQGLLPAMRLKNAKLGDILKFWRKPESRKGRIWEIFEALDENTQQICAAGWEARAKRPNS